MRSSAAIWFETVAYETKNSLVTFEKERASATAIKYSSCLMRMVLRTLDFLIT